MAQISNATTTSGSNTAMESMIAGGLAGFSTRLLLHPFDVVKIRLQLQLEPIQKLPTSKYKSLQHALVCIIKEETPAALWKGHISAQLLSVCYGMVQFGVMSSLTRSSEPLVRDGSITNSMRLFVCGGLAGCCATVAAQPFDVLRTRFIGQGEPRIYTGYLPALRSMLQESRGILSLYRGLTPSVMQVFVAAGVQWTVYAWLNQALTDIPLSFTQQNSYGMNHAIAGAVGGITGKLISYPFDVVKKRLQVQGFEEARLQFGQLHNSNSMVNSFRIILHREGFNGFYKGLLPSLVKACLTTGVVYYFFEFYSKNLIACRRKERCIVDEE